MIGATFCSGIGTPELACPEIDWQRHGVARGGLDSAARGGDAAMTARKPASWHLNRRWSLADLDHIAALARSGATAATIAIDGLLFRGCATGRQ